MIELLRIHALIRTARVPLFVGRGSDRITKACNSKAVELARKLGDRIATRDRGRPIE